MPPAADILIVDDDEDLRLLVVLMLRRAGLHAEAVDSGVAALAAAKRKRRKVIVCDVKMPKVTGLDVCREIKTREAKATQVLLLSANSSAADIAAGYAAGADDYLTKPFDPPELVRRIGALLDQASPLA